MDVWYFPKSCESRNVSIVYSPVSITDIGNIKMRYRRSCDFPTNGNTAATGVYVRILQESLKWHARWTLSVTPAYHELGSSPE